MREKIKPTSENQLVCAVCQEWYFTKTQKRGEYRCPKCHSMLFYQDELGDAEEKLVSIIPMKGRIPLDIERMEFDYSDFWYKKFKFDHPLVQLSFWGSYLAQTIIVVFIFGWRILQVSDFTLITLLIIFTYLASRFMIQKIPRDIEDFLDANQGLFVSPDQYKKYVDTMQHLLFSKSTNRKILFFSILAQILLIALDFNDTIRGVLNASNMGGIPANGDYPILVYLFRIFGSIGSITFTYFGFGVIFLMLNAFKGISELGQTYRLKLSYIDLKLGVIHQLGGVVIAMGVPTVIFTSGVLVFGVVELFIFTRLTYAIGYLSLGVLFDVIFVIFTYRSTIHVHNAIQTYKFQDKKKFRDEINRFMEQPIAKIDFRRLDQIHEFFKVYDRVNDWPFNPTSLKKFAVTIISTVAPALLSLLGFKF